METTTRRYCACLLAAVAALPLGASGADEMAASAGPVLWQRSMNVFRRFDVAPDTMYEFYGDVLGLEQLNTFNVGNGGVARFRAGASELKLTKRVGDREYRPGGVRGATGLRLVTLMFPDEAALTARFQAHGLAAPEFHEIEGTERKYALVDDPDGQAVELIVVPDGPDKAFEVVEVGLTVSDLEKSRAFYRDFVGLEELGPIEDPVFKTTKYAFLHGSTIVSLRSFGGQLPADTGSGGIQYVVSDVDRVAELARKRNVTVEQPLSTLAGFQLRTIWLNDPDGITNYFAETAQARRSRAP
jgi:catechol 2,3-dioxygenase-like lactoylglutathione lyase family enzyme